MAELDPSTGPKLPRVYFLHIPKTSGTAFGGWLRRLYPEADKFPCFEYHELIGRSLAEMQGYRCYSGHFGRSILELLDGPISTITYLRDPVERAASMIQHILRETSENPFFLNRDEIDRIKRSSNPFESMVDAAARRRDVRNGQCYELAKRWDLPKFCSAEGGFTPDPKVFPTAYEMPHGRKLLKVAKEFLDGLPAFGIAEKPGESLEYLTNRLNLPLDGPLQFERLSPERGGTWKPNHWRETLSGWTVRKLEKLTELDRELYGYALKRFYAEGPKR